MPAEGTDSICATEPSRTLNNPDFVVTVCVSLQNGALPDNAVYNMNAML